ncbi:hypothetical protein [Bradyrhizobium sp. HKCCYLS3013]|uniref:hypothetical protein n=1 Tax=Bradyrhizobium sp. HKCCYLS3013 TaxID=3420735 RepID=UPI003EBEFD5B
MALVTVRAIRDSDGAPLGETIFDISDIKGRQEALAQLLNKVYAAAPDPLDPPPFTFRFDKAPT